MFVHPGVTVLSAFYDGELSPSAAARIEEHLKGCEACQVEYRNLSCTANAVRHLATMPAPTSLAARVREQIDSEERGMVPVLRGQIQRSGNHGGFFSALSLGTLASVLLLGAIVLLDYRYGEHAARSLTTALLESTLPEPVLLHDSMSSPRFRDASADSLPEVERGKEGTMLTLASIDQFGVVQDLEVVYRSGDEEMLSQALEVVRLQGFEPAKLGNQSVPVNFLYLFTTTEVRPGGEQLSHTPLWHRVHARRTTA